MAGPTTSALYNLESLSHTLSFLCSCVSSSLCKPSKEVCQGPPVHCVGESPPYSWGAAQHRGK